MYTRFKVFASHNILQYMCDFIHVLIFVVVSKCRKNPKFNEYSDKYSHKTMNAPIIIETLHTFTYTYVERSMITK